MAAADILAAQGGGGQSNFLIPNGTIIVELLIFLIVLGVIWRYVVPPLRRAMQARQEVIRKQIEEAEETRKRLDEAESRYRDALGEARTEAAKIREGARADAQRIKEEMREQADQEVARIRERGEEQLAQQRDQAVRQLRGEVGQLALSLANRLVGESVADDAKRSATVDRFLDELDQMSADGSATAEARSGEGERR